MNYDDKESLLAAYKKFDSINNSNVNLKIIVGYIKPSFLFKTDIFMPVHLGRSVQKNISKDGILSESDIIWLNENCIGDDELNYLSYHNRRIGFFSGTYWAFLNYKRIGNPLYFGQFGYRRLFSPDFIKNIHNYDLILPKKYDFKTITIKDQFTLLHGKNFYNDVYHILKKFNLKDFFDYLERTNGYFDEIYIMKRSLFFDFCNWIYPLVNSLLKIPYKNSNISEKRDLAFIIEHMTGYYLYKKTSEHDISYKEVDTLFYGKRTTYSHRSQNIISFLRKNIKSNS